MLACTIHLIKDYLHELEWLLLHLHFIWVPVFCGMIEDDVVASLHPALGITPRLLLIYNSPEKK